MNSVNDPTTGLDCVPFNYGTEADFVKKVDLSVAGQLMDCAECHVGGGAMEYIPNTDLNARIRLDEMATTNVPGFGGTVAGAPITSASYTAFNYFIDTYDVDGDGDTAEAQYMDYAQAGVMEMDCFLCHLPGYDYVERRHQMRTGKLGTLPAIGAGLATDNGAAFGAADFGTTVVYDESQLDASGTNLQLSGTWMDENVAGVPDSTNCAFCHFNEFSVDWKKRGDHWAPDGQVDFQYEVHYNLGCMGCHQRDAAEQLSWQGQDATSLAENYSPMAAGSLGHDPAKGMYAQYSGLFNMNDNVQFKDCVDCHSNGTAGQSYGAPNPAAAHAAAGLTAVVAQGPTADGVAKASHIDFMHCSACHSRKANSYDWGNTGNPLIDATGKDEEGRLTDHENDYVLKEDMTDNTGLGWFKGKLRRISPSATMFWRDKNDFPNTLGGVDANFDDRPHGMDSLLMTDVLAVNEDNGWASITEDHHGNITPADFAERITAFNSYIDTKAGVAAGTAKTKFSIFHVNFMNQHAVSPANMAFGVNGCTDCHDAGAEFWNGSINTAGDNNMMVYGPSTSQRVPFTKVNGFSQASDWHPNTFDKFAARTIAIQISNVPYDTPVTDEIINVDSDGDGIADTTDGILDTGDGVADSLTTRPVDRAEIMYETTFMGAADYAAEYEGGTIDFSGFEKGWQLIVQVNDGTERLKMVSTDIADVAGLLANLGTNMTDGTFGFTITANTAGDGIKVTGTGGNLIRLRAGNAASFGLTHAAYKNTPWTAVDGRTFNGRADWVAYLNEPKALPAAGEAIIVGLPATVEVGSTVTLTADETANDDAGSVSYSWICNDTTDDPETPDVNEGILDGPVVDKTFSKIGTWTVTLRVVDAYGDLITVSQVVQVTAPAPAADIALVLPAAPAGTGNTVRFSNLPASYTMLYIIWGDGSRQKVYPTGSPASVDVDHTFSTSSRYFNGTDYRYLSTVYVYNGGARVDINREYLFIAP
ncbi:PKD domain-containing protein [Malonomonas rubra DSM 5091]|uniref:PKD domain-containing protein n=1 Tax=Malonomonas rubra DSM 5091 TaxID=1122189 RepID=A0A1M6DUR0_MALRU|nr:PKD domain-containing protein [Malonomonas rubra DSM 5091]